MNEIQLTSLESVADRLEILNLMAKFQYLTNIGADDEWIDLFADDAELVVTVAGRPTGYPPMTGRVAIRKIFGTLITKYGERHRDRSLGERRVYTSGSVAVISQTPESAEVAMPMLLTRIAAEGPSPRIEGSVLYSGTVAKINGRWWIRRWITALDRMPEPF
jgi:SnoaL-like domain